MITPGRQGKVGGKVGREEDLHQGRVMCLAGCYYFSLSPSPYALAGNLVISGILVIPGILW